MSGYAFDKQDETCTVRFAAEFSDKAVTEVESAAEAICAHVRESEVSHLVADLSAVSALPAGLVAVLVQMRRELDQNGRRFTLVVGDPAIKGQLQGAGVGGLWEISSVPTPDSAEADRSATSPSEAAAPAHESKDTSVPASPPTPSSPDKGSANPGSGVPEPPFVFEEFRGYCSIKFTPVLMSLSWADVESATTEVIKKLKASKNDSVMVDLGPMTIINSGLVASLVRIWKTMQERKGQFSLASPNEMVTDVLKAAGLWKLWTVVEDREEAVYELGAGEVAEVEKRERRLLMVTAVPCAIIAVIALVLKYSSEAPKFGANAHLAALLLAAAALTTGILSLIKDKGYRRILSLLAVLTSIGVLSSLWFDENPVAFGREMLNIPEDQPDDDEPSPQERLGTDANNDDEQSNSAQNSSEEQDDSDSDESDQATDESGDVGEPVDDDKTSATDSDTPNDTAVDASLDAAGTNSSSE